jgi:hypothetical protein
MDDTGRCPGCGAILSQPGLPCLRCHGFTAEAGIPPSDAFQAGMPPAKAPMDDDPRFTRGIVRPPQGVWLVWMVWPVLLFTACADVLNAMTQADKSQAIFSLVQGGVMAAWFPSLLEHVSFFHLLSVGASLASAVAIMNWLYFAYNNLHVLSVRGLSYTPFQAVRSCLIPWSIFYVPARVVQEIWQASDPALPADSDAWKLQSRSTLIRLWWAIFMIGFIRISINMTPFPLDNRAMLTVLASVSAINAVASISGTIASLLFCVVVLKVHRRQWQRFEKL